MSFFKSFFKLAQTNPTGTPKIADRIRQGNLTGTLDFPESIDNQSILSYAVSVDANPGTVEKLIRIGVSTQHPYGPTPFEAALDADSPFDVFSLLIDHGILHHSVSKPALVRQLVEKEEIEEKKQAQILDYLMAGRDIDLNDPAFQDAPLVLTAYNNKRKLLVFLLLRFGADIRSIYDEYYAFFDEEMKKVLSKDLLENQPDDSFEYFLPHLNFEDFKTYLTFLDSAGDRQMMILIAKNARISNSKKVELGKIALIKGCDVNEISRDVFGTTALQYYGECYNIGKDTVFADFLLDNGAVLDLNKKSPLLHVVLKNDIEFVKYLIKKGAEPNALTAQNNGIINAFISSRYMDTPAKKIRMLELLVDNGLDINLKSRYFKNDEYPRSTLVDILINKKDEVFLTHVLKAFSGIAIRGDEICDAIELELCDEVCRLLIDKKPDYTATAYYSHKIGDETYTYDAQALEIAISYNRYALADYLIDKYPGVKAHCDHKSLIEKAYIEGFSMDFLEKLIQRDPDINRLYYCTRNDPSYDGQMTTTETTLIRILTLLKKKDAVLDEICEIVMLLLENGADANIPLTKLNISESYTDEEGTLLYAMDAPGDTRLLDLLIDKGGVDPNRPISRHNESQIHAMFGHRGLADEDVLFNLKYFDQKCGLNLDQVDKNNANLLLEAASNCRPKSLQFLLEKGAGIDVIGGFDNSPPLHKAISNLGFLDRSNRARTVEILVSAGADMAQFDSEQFTPDERLSLRLP